MQRVDQHAIIHYPCFKKEINNQKQPITKEKTMKKIIKSTLILTLSILTQSSTYAEVWGQCKSGPYKVYMSTVGVSPDIDRCFYEQTLVNTYDLDEAREIFKEYSHQQIGEYHSFKNFYGNKKLEEFCQDTFSLPVQIPNLKVSVWGLDEFDDFERCDVKYFY